MKKIEIRYEGIIMTKCWNYTKIYIYIYICIYTGASQ